MLLCNGQGRLMSGHFKSMHFHVSLDVCMQDCQRGSSKLQISKVLIVFAHTCSIIEYLAAELHDWLSAY